MSEADERVSVFVVLIAIPVAAAGASFIAGIFAHWCVDFFWSGWRVIPPGWIQ